MQSYIERLCENCQNPFPTNAKKPNRFCNRSCLVSFINKARPRPTLEERFWTFVDKNGPNGCWIWTGCKLVGYGAIMGGREHPKKLLKAHRVSWEIHNGPVPDGLFVLHDCPGGDNRACCNPSHLWLGSAADNSKDAVEKGAIAQGEGSHLHKKTEEEVRKLRHVYSEGNLTQKEAGELFDLSENGARCIIKRITWKHI